MNKKTCTTQMLLSLAVGESIAFPLAKHASVRATCYSVGLTHDRTYTAHANRESRIIKVTRTA